MNARLADIVNSSFQNPSDKTSFFSEIEREVIKREERKEENNNPLQPCHTNLFIGSFFDGTGNNYEADLAKGDKSQSNVARLYSAYPGLSVPGVLPLETEWITDIADYQNYFRIYTSGVGTKFDPVDDSGEGLEASLGNATGNLGEIRIVWVLAQVINVISRFFIKKSIISNEEVKSFGGNLTAASLNVSIKDSLTTLISIKQASYAPSVNSNSLAIIELSKWLMRLHTAISPHMIEKRGGGLPNNKDPGVLQNIYLSTFGFSRGAALARVFSNWLIKLCRIDAYLTKSNGLTLAGFPVTYDFLGLFDTVASVGIVNIVPVFDGHAAWADAEKSLTIPPEIGRCYHFVSAHESRRSFPLDSIYSKFSMPSNGEEIVFPGVHSDLGGGYSPGQQGKGIDKLGRDLLSRIPLAQMYREARISGVPFKLEKALQDDKDGYKISPKLIDDFNAYLSLFNLKSGQTGKIVRKHWAKAIEWRFNLLKNNGIESLVSYERAGGEDQESLLDGWSYFKENVKYYNYWKDDSLSFYSQSYYHPSEEVVSDFNRIKVLQEKSIDIPPVSLDTMLDLYVHDSIAGYPVKNLDHQYLRFRRIYAGADDQYLTRRNPQVSDRQYAIYNMQKNSVLRNT
ncbi:DUF2235 domain-containing protein [Cobetia sp. MMG027]|uniref:T6SS phospholipase effector Tle1-like catalytic domain-containing protein n=1 Tax=Cobetia sp. MMG027 TaxID=3021980 RepID=UPI0022FEBAC0|nr:DUF2235 domain-containing protein [Cobetia sp. MMG027]MDA5565479.1 DUF2235 domain-containing protein [Cobetia sp. MMG027]